MRHLILGAVAALFLGPAALGQEDFVPPSFNEMEAECRTGDVQQPMAPICHVLVYEQWRLLTTFNAQQSFCDTNLFWVAADELLTPELRAGPFYEAIDVIVKAGDICRVISP